MISQRIGITTIGARNISLLRSFYKDLGWEETGISSENYSVFRMAGVFLALFPMKELVKDARFEFKYSCAIGLQGHRIDDYSRKVGRCGHHNQ